MCVLRVFSLKIQGFLCYGENPSRSAAVRHTLQSLSELLLPRRQAQMIHCHVTASSDVISNSLPHFTVLLLYLAPICSVYILLTGAAPLLMLFQKLLHNSCFTGTHSVFSPLCQVLLHSNSERVSCTAGFLFTNMWHE